MNRTIALVIATLAVAVIFTPPVHDLAVGILNLAHGSPVSVGWWWTY